MKHTLFFAGCLLAIAPLAVACGDEETAPDGGSGASDGSGAGAQTGATSASSADSSSSSGAGGMGPGPTRANVSGDVTWDVTFDATAQAAGATNCSYTRHYEGVQDESAKWFCPSCEVILKASVEMTAGQADCYAQISPDAPLEEEWIGYGNGTYYRGIGLRMTEQGTIAMNGATGTITHAVTALEAPVGGTFDFTINGSLTFGEEAGDPMNGFNVPDTYACGWPKANAPAYTGDYTIQNGQTVPDGLFIDRCGETVRLHDLQGHYLIIEMGARDCPPCQALAGDEEAFIADMAAQGVSVYVVTLMAPSLADPLGETTVAMLETWTNNFSLTSPVLADRGWGLSMFLDVFGENTGYPSMVLVDPDLNVMSTQNGFGSFADIEAEILADAQ